MESEESSVSVAKIISRIISSRLKRKFTWGIKNIHILFSGTKLRREIIDFQNIINNWASMSLEAVQFLLMIGKKTVICFCA